MDTASVGEASNRSPKVVAEARGPTRVTATDEVVPVSKGISAVFLGGVSNKSGVPPDVQLPVQVYTVREMRGVGPPASSTVTRSRSFCAAPPFSTRSPSGESYCPPTPLGLKAQNPREGEVLLVQ